MALAAAHGQRHPGPAPPPAGVLTRSQRRDPAAVESQAFFLQCAFLRLMAGEEVRDPRRVMYNLPWLSSGSIRGWAECHRGDLWAQRLCPLLLVTFPQEKKKSYKHLGDEASLAYPISSGWNNLLWREGRGERVTWEENVLPVPETKGALFPSRETGQPL